MKRSELREEIFKIIFYLEIKKENMQGLINNFIEEKKPYEDEIEYIKMVTSDIIAKMDILDDIIKTHLRNWSFERLSKMSIAILRLAVYEIAFIEEIPVKVSVNEAMELAKKYDEEKNQSFINGVLAEYINKGKD